jgi:hypothetical protein
MTTTIAIAHEIDATAVARVQALLNETALRDPNWNGAEFEIVRDDYTCIPADESYNAAALLNRIQAVIQSRND